MWGVDRHGMLASHADDGGGAVGTRRQVGGRGGRARRSAGRRGARGAHRVAASATPTSTWSPATCPSRTRWSAATRAPGGCSRSVAGVTDVEVGDPVVMTFLPSCGRCPYCARGLPNLCNDGAGATLGPQLDGTYRFHARGEDIGQMCLLGTFAKHTVVPVKSVVKIDEGFPLDLAALVGCGVTTGFGSAVRTRGPAGRRHRRRDRRRRDRRERRAGRPGGGLPVRRRRRPGGVQAREGAGAGRHARRRRASTRRGRSSPS